MGKGLLLWLLGVPIPIIILLFLFLALTAMAKTREEAPILEDGEWTKESRISAARVREILGPAVADRL
jgi:hypothetical protein